MEWINTYGSYASVIALALVLGGFAIRMYKKFREKAEKTKADFNQEMERFKAAGSTVSGRTDLGFFVQLELESLRGALAEHRFFCTLAFFAILPVIIYFITSFTAYLPRATDTVVFKNEQKDFLEKILAKDPEAYKKVGDLDALRKIVETPLTVPEIEILESYKVNVEKMRKFGHNLFKIHGIFFIIFFLFVFMDARSRSRIQIYEEIVKDIWRQPVYKRADKEG